MAVPAERMKTMQAQNETGQERLQRIVADLRADLARRISKTADQLVAAVASPRASRRFSMASSLRWTAEAISAIACPS